VDFEIVTAVSNDKYLKKMELTIPTWNKKPQFKNRKLTVFHIGFDDLSKLDFIKEYFPDVNLVKWELEGCESQRELVLSCFVLGVKHIKSEYYVKFDCDSFVTDTQDVFLEGDFKYDLFSNSWGYTKPGKWIRELDEWCERNNIEGEPIYNPKKDRGEKYRHRRIASFICLHKTEFVRNIVNKYVDKRLPVPSHDTFLWYMAERLLGRKWGGASIKQRGVSTRTSLRGLRSEIYG
jgi:hypothetical protein